MLLEYNFGPRFTTEHSRITRRLDGAKPLTPPKQGSPEAMTLKRLIDGGLGKETPIRQGIFEF